MRLQLEEWLEMFWEKQLTNKKQYAYFQGKALAEIIAQTTFQRERRYLPLVEAFARAMQALENEEFDNEPDNN